MEHLIGMDIGTQGAKGLMIDRDGKQVGSSYSGYDVLQPKPLWAEQWPEVWVQGVSKALRLLLESASVEAGHVAAIAISGLYGGSGVPVDTEMNPLAPCLIWMDRRAEKEVRWVKANVDLDRLYDITGNTVDSYYGFTKMLWIKNNLPEVWRRLHRFLPPKEYVVFRLTGEEAIDYSSAGNIGGLFDLKKRRWSEEMADRLGLPLRYQPQKLVRSDEIVGRLTKEGAALTGLLEGTPVVAGGIDAAVATLSSGVLKEGSHVAMIGTSMCWGFITNKPNLSPKLVSFPNVVDPLNKIYTFGGAATAGAVVRWFRDVFGGLELEAEKQLGIDAYTLLELKCKNVPAGSEGLLVLPYFMGERSPIWDGNARGTILGLSLYHRKEHLYNALMEGVAYALRHNMESVSGTPVVLDPEMILVGGAARSLVWPQICADVTGYPVRIVKSETEAPLGDALLAGLATGLVERPEAILRWLEFQEPILPKEDNTRLYDRYFEEYKQIYLNLKDPMNRLYSS
jgi:sugar (pentulose or hexulose) kinase